MDSSLKGNSSHLANSQVFISFLLLFESLLGWDPLSLSLSLSLKYIHLPSIYNPSIHSLSTSNASLFPSLFSLSLSQLCFSQLSYSSSMDMDAYSDYSIEDALFVELERRLLLLISEGEEVEEEKEMLAQRLPAKLDFCNVYPPVNKEPFVVHSSLKGQPIKGTGVFIPRSPLPPEAARPSRNHRRKRVPRIKVREPKTITA